jgi:MoxR-like ATPase
MLHTNILKADLFTPFRGRWGVPLLFWGMPGVAKTAVIEEITAKFNMICETLSPSERGEGAFGVIPVPVTRKDGTTILTYPAPDWVEKFMTAGRGVVFVDEATSTPPALQAPLMGLIHARRIGGVTFGPGVRVVAAANPPEFAAGGYDLAPPLANRFGHLDWTPPTEDEHIQFMLRGSSGTARLAQHLNEMAEDLGEDAPADAEAEMTYDAEAEERRVLKAWPEAWAVAVGLETAFIRRRPGLKNKLADKKVDATSLGRAYPSDRTWDLATHAYASAIVHNLSEAEHETFVEAFIGAGVAGEWFTFIREQNLPDPAKLLDGKEKFKHDSTRIDRTVAVLQSCVALIAPKGAAKRSERSSALWSILEKMTEDKADLDIIVPTVHALIDSELHAMKDAAKTLAKINPILKKAGIQPGGRSR